MATNDDPYPNGTDKSTHKRVLSPVSSCSDHRGSPHARHQRVGIELEPIITSRKRTGSDGSAEAGQQRLRTSGSPDDRATHADNGDLALAVLFVALFIENMTVFINGGEIVTGEVGLLPGSDTS